MDRQELLRVVMPFFEEYGFSVSRAKAGLLKSLYGPEIDFFSATDVQLFNAMVYVYWRKHLLLETVPPALIHPSLSPDGTKTSNKRLLKQLARLASDWGRLLTGRFDPAEPELLPEYNPTQGIPARVPQPFVYMEDNHDG